MMTHEHITLVQQSFYALQSSGNIRMFVTRFYARLFLLDTSLHYLFPTHLEEQENELLQMLSFIVEHLGNTECLLPQIAQLGVQHSSYAVLAQHYTIVGSALLWALEKELGAAFTPAVRQAWEAVYNFIAATMLNAVHPITGERHTCQLNTEKLTPPVFQCTASSSGAVPPCTSA